MFGAMLGAGGCAPRERALEPGSYRAVLTSSGGELPFGLDVAREESGYVLYVINGPERIRVPEVQTADGRVHARMPGYDTTLDARIGRDGRLEGHMTMLRPGGKRQSLPFAATLGQTWRFFEDPPTDNADVSGRWAVQITTDDGAKLACVAEFSQSFAQVHGTLLTPFGDARFLSGEVHGDKLYLSRFDGGNAHLYRASIDEDGTLQGETWGDTIGHYRWTAQRDPDAALELASAVTGANDTDAALEFAVPDLEGRTVTHLDPRFVAKVVILTVSGSWCPNCHDEAVVLNDLYAAYHDRGLEIVSLMFEYHDDPALARSAVLRFRDKYRIQYPLLLAGTTDEDSLARTLPQMHGIYAYPTTLILDRRGHVRRVDSGFAGPATGARYDNLRFDLSRFVEALLSEPAPAT